MSKTTISSRPPCCRSWKRGAPCSSRTTTSPSSTTSGSLSFDNAAATAGKRGARSSSFRLHIAISPSTIAATARKPSYFSSYTQLFESRGGDSASVASIGGKTRRRRDWGVGFDMVVGCRLSVAGLLGCWVAGLLMLLCFHCERRKRADNRQPTTDNRQQSNQATEQRCNPATNSATTTHVPLHQEIQIDDRPGTDRGARIRALGWLRDRWRGD